MAYRSQLRSPLMLTVFVVVILLVLLVFAPAVLSQPCPIPC